MPPEHEMRSDERIPADTVYRQIVVTIDEQAPFEMVAADVCMALADASIRYRSLPPIPELGIIAVELDEGQDVFRSSRDNAPAGGLHSPGVSGWRSRLIQWPSAAGAPSRQPRRGLIRPASRRGCSRCAGRESIDNPEQSS
jgi:hypothetical protein